MNYLTMIRFALMCIWCFCVTALAFAGEGATLDGYTIRVSKGAPPAVPSMLAKGEKGTFNFTVTLSHNGIHIEEVPPGMTLAYRVSSPEESKITNVEPKTYGFPPGGIQYVRGKAVDANNIDSNVSAEVDFRDLTGKQSVTLRVSLIRDSDSVGVADSETIEVEIVSATLTVYADPPKKPVSVIHVDENAICLTGNDIGHSFWKVEVEKRNEWGTDKKIKLRNAEGEQNQASQDVVGIPYGFYPLGWDKLVLALIYYEGTIGDDRNNGHFENAVSKTYSISVADAQKVIDTTISLVSGHIYHLANLAPGKNCTKQCVYVGKTVAGCNTPNGVGMITWRENDKISIAIPSLIPFANPYHHSQQLRQSN